MNINRQATYISCVKADFKFDFIIQSHEFISIQTLTYL